LVAIVVRRKISAYKETDDRVKIKKTTGCAWTKPKEFREEAGRGADDGPSLGDGFKPNSENARTRFEPSRINLMV
jgi:hypothetical protein